METSDSQSTYRLRKLISARRVFGNIAEKNISKDSVWTRLCVVEEGRSGNTARWLSANSVRIWVKLTSIPRQRRPGSCITPPRIRARGEWNGCERTVSSSQRWLRFLVGVLCCFYSQTRCTLSKWLSLHRERFVNAPSSDERTTGQITGGAFDEIHKNKKSTLWPKYYSFTLFIHSRFLIIKKK